MLNDEKRGTEEHYSSAVSTSDLKIDGYQARKPIDMVIAAGMNRSRLGMALLRLKSEWDRTPKPTFPPPAVLAKVAAGFTREKSGLVRYRESVRSAKGRAVDQVVLLTPPEAAMREAWRWHSNELGLVMGRLKELPNVRAALVHWATDGQPDPDAIHLVAAVVLWWLDDTCQTCNGVKWRVAEGTGRTTARACKSCNGTGLEPAPYKDDHARRDRAYNLRDYIGECLHAARGGLAAKFDHCRHPVA